MFRKLDADQYSHAGLFGVSGFFLEGRSQPWDLAFFLFHMVFCVTAITIVSGAVAERMRFGAYQIIAILISLFIYPLIGHWAWGGAERGIQTGWLSQLGFIDFAGSTVVHSVGGWVALAAILVVGPRIRRFKRASMAIHGHNLSLAALGAMIIWFGWFGFNGGSTLGVTDKVPQILVNTSLSGAFGCLGAMAVSWPILKRPNIGILINGSLSGLVGITASCHLMSPSGAVAMGFISGVLCFAVTCLLERLQIDDAVGAFPVHCVSGMWGTLGFLFFSSPEKWGTGLGLWEQFSVQLTGIFVTFLWAFGGSFAFLKFINHWVTPLRVTEEEDVGLNISEHGARTEMLDLAWKMESQRKSGDFSRKVNEQLDGEIRQIAVEYNGVLGRVNLEKNQAEKMTEVALKAQQEMEIANHQLEETIQDLSEFNQLAEGREIRMIDLKTEINEMAIRLGETNRYNVEFDDARNIPT
ncbi:MAG TPA: hypothetical protein EYQ50_06935 [Verrucomicrobiales bacterium]|nr:hypothetical protein [Verrucomicrobiales bacterium]